MQVQVQHLWRKYRPIELTFHSDHYFHLPSSPQNETSYRYPDRVQGPSKSYRSDKLKERRTMVDSP